MRIQLFKVLAGLIFVVSVLFIFLMIDASRGPGQAAGEAFTPVISVRTERLIASDGYVYSRELTGRVRAARSSALGFELGGRLARVYVDEGEAVSGGMLLAELDRGRLLAQRNEQQAALTEAEANLSLARVTLARLANIVDKGAVSRQGLDEARESWRVAEARLQRIKLQIEAIEVDLTKSELRAPYDGVITLRHADEGRVLQAGTALFGLQEKGMPEIQVGLAGPLADRLQVGETHAFQWQERRFEARLRTILPLRSDTRTVSAIFDPVSPTSAVRAGDLVRLVVSERVETSGYWLPLTALTEGRRGLWAIYVMRAADSPPEGLSATHRLVRRTIDLVHQEVERVYVSGSFANGDRVVIDGLQRLVPGQWVQEWQDATLPNERISANGGE